ncbi:36383_t:CDS:2 [Racocetra persica]|uniref:36383_t:CDS:1 n=1 Tax=Racocetra persica TaxID=160502 RepID=A0ACA9KAK3_9GLOM|nr:36383_t:CDS:2 [Racocetra persica]
MSNEGESSQASNKYIVTLSSDDCSMCGWQLDKDQSVEQIEDKLIDLKEIYSKSNYSTLYTVSNNKSVVIETSWKITVFNLTIKKKVDLELNQGVFDKILDSTDISNNPNNLEETSTNMFTSLNTAYLAIYIMLTGNSSYLSNWSLTENLTLMFLSNKQKRAIFTSKGKGNKGACTQFQHKISCP